MIKLHTKVWLMLFLLMLLMLIGGYFFGGRSGLFWGFVTFLFFSTTILLFGESALLKKLKAHELKGQDPDGVIALTQELKELFFIKDPVKVYEIPFRTVNLGFAFSQNYQPALIVTKGFLDRTSISEKRVLLSMALAQVKQRESLLWMMASFLVNGTLSAADWVDSHFPENLNLFRFFLAPLGHLILGLFGYKRICIQADRKALEVVPLPEVMGACIENYGHMNVVSPIEFPPCSSHLFLFSKKIQVWGTHPSLQKRCRQIFGTYPI